MQINLQEELLSFVNEQALTDNVSIEVWCERKLNGAIRRVMKDELVNNITSSSIEHIEIYKTAVESAKKGIDVGTIEKEAKDKVNPPKVIDSITSSSTVK